MQQLDEYTYTSYNPNDKGSNSIPHIQSEMNMNSLSDRSDQSAYSCTHIAKLNIEAWCRI